MSKTADRFVICLNCMEVIFVGTDRVEREPPSICSHLYPVQVKRYAA